MDPALSRWIRDHLKAAPDMPRALSRLSLNRGGPRDLGAICVGLGKARELLQRLEGLSPPNEILIAVGALLAAPLDLERTLRAALADDLPLLARDGGFVRDGHDGELDELRRLRDDSRQVIARMQAHYCDQTGVRSLKIRHNNVLGYFIEVTATNAAALTGAKESFIHRQTLANVMRFTTTELSELESRIANAAGRAIEIELAAYARLQAETVVAADAIIATAAS
jgi:DNA mismatch repair protein MutS